MNKKIVTLSDTSHPFTSYEAEPVKIPRADETDRVDEFLKLLETDETERSWHNDPKHNNPDYDRKPVFSDNEVKALASLEGEKSDEYEILNNWDKVEEPDTKRTEKTDNALEILRSWRKLAFKKEADKRVYRYFIGRTGWAWYVHYIVDMPENYDIANPTKALYEAKDGMTTLHMTSLFMTEEKAWDSINTDIREITAYTDDVLTHVIELDKI